MPRTGVIAATLLPFAVGAAESAAFPGVTEAVVEDAAAAFAGVASASLAFAGGASASFAGSAAASLAGVATEAAFAGGAVATFAGISELAFAGASAATFAGVVMLALSGAAVVAFAGAVVLAFAGAGVVALTGMSMTSREVDEEYPLPDSPSSSCKDVIGDLLGEFEALTVVFASTTLTTGATAVCPGIDGGGGRKVLLWLPLTRGSEGGAEAAALPSSTTTVSPSCFEKYGK
jgi:hypothetical protein